MHKLLIKLTVIIGLIAVISLPKNANAFGIGIYLPVYGSGSGTFTLVDYDDAKVDYDWEYNGGFGIVLDTKVAKRGLFNYRLNLGMVNTNQTFGDADYSNTLEGFKYYMFDNTFGFGIVQTKIVRVWLGPQLGLAFMSYKDSDDYSDNSWNAVGFTFAPVLGANFNFGRMFTVAMDMGYKFSSFAGTAESTYYDDSYGYDVTDSDSFTQSHKGFFINLSLILRLGDVFDSGVSDYDDDKPNYDEEYY